VVVVPNALTWRIDGPGRQQRRNGQANNQRRARDARNVEAPQQADT